MGYPGTLPPRPYIYGYCGRESTIDRELFSKVLGGRDADVNKAAEVNLRRAVERRGNLASTGYSTGPIPLEGSLGQTAANKRDLANHALLGASRAATAREGARDAVYAARQDAVAKRYEASLKDFHNRGPECRAEVRSAARACAACRASFGQLQNPSLSSPPCMRACARIRSS